MEESKGIISCRTEQKQSHKPAIYRCLYKMQQAPIRRKWDIQILNSKEREPLLCKNCLHLELSCIHADVNVLFSLAAVLQMVESFNLVQGVQQTPGEQVDPQHTGWVYTELEAIQLGIQV